MVTSGTDDKSRTSESNLAGENERAKIESSFLRYVRAYHTNRGRLSLSLSLSLSFSSRSFTIVSPCTSNYICLNFKSA